MNRLHKVYQLEITTLSPLHIGTGRRLLRDYDYVTHAGKTWVIDAGALAEALYDQDAAFKLMVDGEPAGNLLQASDYTPDSPLFRYVMAGQPRSNMRGAELQEQLKDPWDRPYIPGSSLKGALRTALAVVGWYQRGLGFRYSDLTDSRPKFAALPLERRVLNGGNTPMGRAPNHDLLRALHVSDSGPDDQRRLQLINVQVIVNGKSASPVELEAIPAGVTFTATLALDGFLRQPGTASALGWANDQLKWLSGLPTAVNAFTGMRLGEEWKRWQGVPGMMRSFYQDLRNRFGARNDRAEFYLQLGWGGGWDSKTLGAVLTQDGDVFAQVVTRYHLKRKGKYQPGEVFPRSRRVLMNGQNAPARPLGWIHVKMVKLG